MAMTVFFGDLEHVTRTMPPVVGGTQFHTPDQMYFRRRQQGFEPTPHRGANLPVRRLRRHATGAASMENLEPDTDTYRAVLGEWGRPTRAATP